MYSYLRKGKQSMSRRTARFHTKGDAQTQPTIASSIHDVNYYGTVVQNKETQQNEMVLTEVSMLRMIVGIHMKDQGNGKEIDRKVWETIQLESHAQPNAPIV